MWAPPRVDVTEEHAPSHQQVVLQTAPAALRCDTTLPTTSLRCHAPFALTETTFMAAPSSDCQTISDAPEPPNLTAVLRTIHGYPCSCAGINSLKVRAH